jgi:ribosomal protein S18 acetylase RimI-like enzyme
MSTLSQVDVTVRVATSGDEIAACFPILVQLRPHLKAEHFISTVRAQERAGYRLAYLEVDGQPVAVAGYRISTKLSTGRFLFVDDLVTDEACRSKGYGSRLLTWLFDEAAHAGCQSVQLDTGVQRQDAQRFYERERMRWSAYRYEWRIPAHETSGRNSA